MQNQDNLAKTGKPTRRPAVHQDARRIALDEY